MRPLCQLSDVGSRTHSNICRTRVTSELAETQTGRPRIAAVSERLDKTVEELGQRFRTDVHQGEKSEVMAQHQPTERVIPRILPIPQRAQSNEAQPSVRDESMEVPPPADEPGVGETHGLEGSTGTC